MGPSACGAASINNWKGKHLYIVFASLTYFEINCLFKVCEHKYMNTHFSNYSCWLAMPMDGSHKNIYKFSEWYEIMFLHL